MAQTTIELVAERVIEELFDKYELFDGYQRMQEIDCSNTNIGSGCWEEIFSRFKGMKSILLKNCKDLTDLA